MNNRERTLRVIGESMTKQDLHDLVAYLPRIRVGVVGDFCLDVYWTLDMTASEPSLETGLPTSPVRKQATSLGGAGNVVNNLATMWAGSIQAFGAIGTDPFGQALRCLLENSGIELDGLLVQPDQWDTPAYVKPVCGQDEENRGCGNK